MYPWLVPVESDGVVTGLKCQCYTTHSSDARAYSSNPTGAYMRASAHALSLCTSYVFYAYLYESFLANTTIIKVFSALQRTHC